MPRCVTALLALALCPHVVSFSSMMDETPVCPDIAVGQYSTHFLSALWSCTLGTRDARGRDIPNLSISVEVLWQDECQLEMLQTVTFEDITETESLVGIIDPTDLTISFSEEASNSVSIASLVGLQSDLCARPSRVIVVAGPSALGSQPLPRVKEP